MSDSILSIDYCRCASSQCEKYNECMRGGADKYVGIVTLSYLHEVCNSSNNYENLITRHQ